MSVATLLLLGGFELTLSSGAPVLLPRRKAQALLVYLACHPCQAHRRDKLAALLGRLWLRAGSGDEAPQHLALATAMSREIGMRIGPAAAVGD